MRSLLHTLGKILKYIFFFLLVCLTLFINGYIIFSFIVQPSNDRDWSTDLAVLPHAEIKGDLVTIHDIRNFTYRSTLDYTPGYYDKTFDLREIKTVDFIVEPFSTQAAHTFLTFGFSDGSQVAISIEVRREKGEWFDAFKGFFRQFELVYVIADEKDVLKLRTNYRDNAHVYMYPIKTTKERMKLLFVDMVQRANSLYEKPEFYNSVWSNCTTNIVAHANKIREKKIRWSYRYELPVYSGELAYDLGLINDTGTFEEIQAKYEITGKAKACGDCVNYSEAIRK